MIPWYMFAHQTTLVSKYTFPNRRQISAFCDLKAKECMTVALLKGIENVQVVCFHRNFFILNLYFIWQLVL